MGQSGAKQGQMVANRVKRGQTGSNGAKKGQKVPYGPIVAKRAKQGQMGHMGLIFCMHAYFYEIKKSCLATQALRQKLTELWQYCYFVGYYGPSLKALSLLLYLSEENFFISSES